MGGVPGYELMFAGHFHLVHPNYLTTNLDIEAHHFPPVDLEASHQFELLWEDECRVGWKGDLSVIQHISHSVRAPGRGRRHKSEMSSWEESVR